MSELKTKGCIVLASKDGNEKISIIKSEFGCGYIKIVEHYSEKTITEHLDNDEELFSQISGNINFVIKKLLE